MRARPARGTETENGQHARLFVLYVAQNHATETSRHHSTRWATQVLGGQVVVEPTRQFPRCECRAAQRHLAARATLHPSTKTQGRIRTAFLLNPPFQITHPWPLGRLTNAKKSADGRDQDPVDCRVHCLPSPSNCPLAPRRAPAEPANPATNQPIQTETVATPTGSRPFSPSSRGIPLAKPLHPPDFRPPASQPRPRLPLPSNLAAPDYIGVHARRRSPPKKATRSLHSPLTSASSSFAPSSLNERCWPTAWPSAPRRRPPPRAAATGNARVRRGGGSGDATAPRARDALDATGEGGGVSGPGGVGVAVAAAAAQTRWRIAGSRWTCFPTRPSETSARALAGLPDEYLVVLVGDMVTEEALPTYQTMINTLDGVRDETGASASPWALWTRTWTAEENRHGDVLGKYMYLSGRVDMPHGREDRPQYLIGSGMDPGTRYNPYLGFVYTSFQERATAVSHGNTARLAQGARRRRLARTCGTIAADEKRHEAAYGRIVEHCWGSTRRAACGITMPAHLMHDGRDMGLRLGVYTARDYADIVEFPAGSPARDAGPGTLSAGSRRGCAAPAERAEDRARRMSQEGQVQLDLR
ncbi:hypothetical protein HU200_007053 [Digitaria exilis]|uniref:Uncharacterized protein n=1 Tax=Digitaria exilis TaxID=1010633 RepID=A0A835KSW0_9POAL|nr:hypothetical protein HU200_007053 [Digitaria exilis]